MTQENALQKLCSAMTVTQYVKEEMVVLTQIFQVTQWIHTIENEILALNFDDAVLAQILV